MRNKKLVAGVAPSIAAAAALVLTTSLIAEIAAVPTADPGVHSSTWTPLTAISALFFGQDAFHGSFALGPIAFGLLVVALVSILVGSIGAALIVYSLGRRPHPPAAALLGAAWGLAMQIVLINLLCNRLQDDNALYRSLPSWGWFVGMGAWGATLGLSLSAAGRRTPATEPELTVEGAGGGVSRRSPLLSGDPSPGTPHQEPTR